MFDDVELDTVGTVVLVVLLAIMVLVAVAVNVIPRITHKREIEYKTRDLTYGAACLAMSYALSWARLFRMPAGGSVTPASLVPLFIYCYYFGFRKGMVITTAYTMLQLLQGASIVSPWSAFFDYIFPYFAICLIGLFAYKPDKYNAFIKRHTGENTGAFKNWALTIGGHWGIFAGAAIHAVLRYLSQCISSMLFWAYGAPPFEAFVTGLAYNAYGLVDSGIALVAAVILLSSRAFNMYMTASFADKKAFLEATEKSEEDGDGVGVTE